MTAAVHVFVWALTLYLGAGLLFAIPFALFGVQRIDSQAHAASAGFRLIIVPGTAALWPLLLYRWARGINDPPVEQNAHRTAAIRTDSR